MEYFEDGFPSTAFGSIQYTGRDDHVLPTSHQSTDLLRFLYWCTNTPADSEFL